MRLLTLVAFLFWVCGNTAHAQTVEMSRTHFGGECWDMELVDETLYAACGPRVDVYDVKDPTNPTLIGSTDDYAEIGNIVMLGDRWLYVTGVDGKLRIFDMASPSGPALAGEIEVNVWSSVTVDSSFTNDELKLVLNMTKEAMFGAGTSDEKDHMKAAKMAATGGPPATLEVYSYDVEVTRADSKNVLLSAEGDEGMRVYDLTNPSSPKLLDTFVLGGELLLDVAVHKDTVFVAVLMHDIQVLNIGDPKNIVGRGTLSTKYTRHLEVYPAEDGYPARLITTSTGSSSNPTEVFNADTLELLATVGNGWNGALSGPMAYVSGNHNLAVINTDTGAWTLLEGPTIHELGAIELGKNHQYIYVASRATGLHVIDVRTPLKPAVAAQILIPGTVEETAWPFAWGRRGIYKLSLDTYGTFDFEAYHFLDYVQHVGTSTDRSLVFACTPNTIWDTWKGVVILDADLSPLGSLKLPYGCMASSYTGDFLYITSFDGFRVVDVSDPTDPWVVEESLLKVPRTRDGSEVIKDGKFILVADEESGIAIYKTRTGSPVRSRKWMSYLPLLLLLIK